MKLFYAIRERSGLRRYVSRVTNSVFDYKQGVELANRFASVRAILEAIARREAAGRDCLFENNFDIVKVEETVTPSTREIITKGDLSLLDGPVVLYSMLCSTYLATVDGKSDRFVDDLNDADVFSGTAAALSAIQDRVRLYHNGVNSKLSSSFAIRPIRTTAGKTEYKETVLA